MNSFYFSDRNAVYKIIFDYCQLNNILFLGDASNPLTANSIKKLISNGELLIDKKPKRFIGQKLFKTSVIHLPLLNIEFQAIFTDEKNVTSPEGQPTIIEIDFKNDDINLILAKYFRKYLNIDSPNELKSVDEKLAFCMLVVLIEKVSFDEIKVSSDSYVITDFINHIYNHSALNKELKFPKNVVNFASRMIESLILNKHEKFSQLQNVKNQLLGGLYDQNLYRFLQDYNKIISSPSFQYLLEPQLNNINISRLAVENLIKPISSAKNHQGLDLKYLFYQDQREIYDRFFSQLDLKNFLHDDIYSPIATYLYQAFKKECEVAEVKTAEIEVVLAKRKYNFDNVDRAKYELMIDVKNTGEGLARDAHIISTNKNFTFSNFEVGLLKPQEVRIVTLPVEIIPSENFDNVLSINIKWLDTSNEWRFKSIDLLLQTQKNDVPWEKLNQSKPYTIQEIEDRSKLYGRDDILSEMITNITSQKIESYKIWGQKRVGKSSIVKTLKNVLKNQDSIIVVWRSIAGLINTSPELTLNNLGESLCSEIFEEIDSKKLTSAQRQQLRLVSVPEFNGSLYPLELYIKKLRRIDSTFKFVFILDEFDRINEEFFLPGKLGDTLSLNIGKGLNENSFVGFILVGSENMHLLDRQGINYNSYQEREIDTFNRETEYNSFKNIVIGPVEPHIKYSAEAIERIFEVTNGNPYFANLICSNIFKIAFKNRDSEIDYNVAEKAIKLIVNASQKSHFEHFWSDGITDESNIKKEKKADVRRRILVSYSTAYYLNGEFPSRQLIVKYFNKPPEYSVENFEIENMIKEFFNRKIFSEDQGNRIRIKPSLFEGWLCGPGRTLLIEGVSDLEALQREQQKEKEYELKNDEITRLSETLIFKGNRVPLNQLVAYFNQFGGPIEQRRVFKLIDNIVYISKHEITEFFRKEQKHFFKKDELELKLGAKTIIREGVETYSFPETIKENKTVFDVFKILTHVRSSKTLKDIASQADIWKQNGADQIIIFESIIDNYQRISEYLNVFLKDEAIEKVSVKLITLLITNKAKAEIIKSTSGIENFKLIHFREVEDATIKPFIETTRIFETQEELSYAFAEVRRQFQNIQNGSTNIVFETHCPAFSLPILWCRTANFEPLFYNEFGIYQDLMSAGDGEELRTRLFLANTEFSQQINRFIVSFLKQRAAFKGLKSWLNVELIPKKVLESISIKYIADDQKNSEETYFDFLDYKKIIERHPELIDVFKIKGENLAWLDRLNELRRDPAHPEKPAPALPDVEYYEKIKNMVMPKLKANDFSN